MALNIKDPETDRLVRELAAATGESITTAVSVAVEERLKRVRPDRGELVAEINEIVARVSALPEVGPDPVTYDEHGAPN